MSTWCRVLLWLKDTSTHQGASRTTSPQVPWGLPAKSVHRLHTRASVPAPASLPSGHLCGCVSPSVCTEPLQPATPSPTPGQRSKGTEGTTWSPVSGLPGMSSRVDTSSRVQTARAGAAGPGMSGGGACGIPARGTKDVPGAVTSRFASEEHVDGEANSRHVGEPGSQDGWPLPWTQRGRGSRTGTRPDAQPRPRPALPHLGLRSPPPARHPTSWLTLR